MNYYEELGLARSASAEDIRQAYRQAAKLLHPDQCREQDLRGLAECQMRRLNGIVEVLTDPEERRRYDLLLAAGRPALRRRRRRPLWIAAAAAAVGCAVLLLAARRPARRAVPVAGTAPAAAAIPAASPISAPIRPEAPRRSQAPSVAEREVRKLRAELEAAREEIDLLRASPPATPAAAASPAPPSPAPEPSGRTEPAPPFRQAHAASYSGEWFYVRQPGEALPPGLYPPEYVELSVVEKAGMLSGRLRSRYEVRDRPISPVVTFRFAGESGGASLPWSGPGGAEGRVSLRLVSRNTLEVDWIATQLGGELGLASGKARLIRRREPD